MLNFESAIDFDIVYLRQYDNLIKKIENLGIGDIYYMGISQKRIIEDHRINIYPWFSKALSENKIVNEEGVVMIHPCNS